MSPISLPLPFVDLLRQRPATVALTGAGVSAQSGVPTFRDAQTGLWARYRAQDLATPEAFQRDPELVWRWYQWRRQLVGRAEPNAAHRALAELQRRLPEFTLVTQNVDGLHERAGNRDVLNLHGSLRRNRCNDCGTQSEHPDDCCAQAPPHCARCGGRLRPAVVWFGEALPGEMLATAAKRVARATLVLVVGTSAQVYPAAALAEQALDQGATVVEINPERTPLSVRVTFRLPQPAARALPCLVEALDERH